LAPLEEISEVPKVQPGLTLRLSALERLRRGHRSGRRWCLCDAREGPLDRAEML